ncbi:MAG: glycosyltransferase family 2 protein [Chitinophagaceae bacterium]
MKKLSVVIITFNEESNIARCIISIKNIADEIIVVDSYSEDNTAPIAEQLGAIVYKQQFLGYIEQKNFALQKATNDYCLLLDADECLSKELENSIQQLKNGGFNADGYSFNRCNNYRNKWIKHGAWYPNKTIRLLNKSKGKWGGTNPHDKIVMDSNATVATLTGDLLHYSYASIEDMIQQNNRFTTIQAKAMFMSGKRSSYFKIIINPTVAFISSFFIKRGFLDGIDGFIIAKSIAFHTLHKYAKLLYLQQDANKDIHK